MRTIAIDFSAYQNAKAVHAFLQKALDFPDYYGQNLDALHDVLTDEDRDTTVYLIPADTDFEKGFYHVFTDAARENAHITVKNAALIPTLKTLMSIDSPSGYYKAAEAYLVEYFSELGFKTTALRKGGVLAEIGGEGEPLLVMAHADTLGAVVGEIKPNGHLKLSNVTLAAPNIEAYNCHVITEDDRVYDATVQLTNPSVHVNGKYRDTARDFDTLEVVLDENVFTKEEVEALGIQAGDAVAVDPNFTMTAAGYVKSRYLDDKASVAILMDTARDVAAGRLKLSRKVYFLITMYEEYGMGGNCGIPEDVVDILSVDMGCVGEGLSCNEHQVSICRKDSGNVYHRGMTHELISLAKDGGINYAVDIYPFYSSDAVVAMRSGYDFRHALIGPGVYASHGYERTHLDGIYATKALLEGYIGEA